MSFMSSLLKTWSLDGMYILLGQTKINFLKRKQSLRCWDMIIPWVVWVFECWFDVSPRRNLEVTDSNLETVALDAREMYVTSNPPSSSHRLEPRARRVWGRGLISYKHNILSHSEQMRVLQLFHQNILSIVLVSFYHIICQDHSIWASLITKS